MRTPPPAAPRRGPIADGAARMRRPSVLSEGQSLAADGIYFRPRFFNRVPTGAGRACGWSCIRELGATPTSKKMTNGPRCGRRLPQLHVGAPSQMGRRACAVQAFCPKDKALPRTEFTSGRGFSIGSPQARDAPVGGAAPQNGGERGFLMNITGPRCGCGFPQLHAGARLLFVPFRRMGRRWFPS